MTYSKAGIILQYEISMVGIPFIREVFPTIATTYNRVFTQATTNKNSYVLFGSILAVYQITETFQHILVPTQCNKLGFLTTKLLTFVA